MNSPVACQSLSQWPLQNPDWDSVHGDARKPRNSQHIFLHQEESHQLEALVSMLFSSKLHGTHYHSFRGIPKLSEQRLGISFCGGFRSRRLQVSLKSSQLEEVEGTAIRDLWPISLLPWTFMIGLLMESIADTPI